jgi:hypothetical protein
MITLNNNQKWFLFDKNYVDQNALDAAIYDGWEEHFIRNFDWELTLELNRWRLRKLVLKAKDTGITLYTIELNFRNNDLQKLLNLE